MRGRNGEVDTKLPLALAIPCVCAAAAEPPRAVHPELLLAPPRPPTASMGAFIQPEGASAGRMRYPPVGHCGGTGGADLSKVGACRANIVGLCGVDEGVLNGVSRWAIKRGKHV